MHAWCSSLWAILSSILSLSLSLSLCLASLCPSPLSSSMRCSASLKGTSHISLDSGLDVDLFRETAPLTMFSRFFRSVSTLCLCLYFWIVIFCDWADSGSCPRWICHFAVSVMLSGCIKTSFTSFLSLIWM